MRFYLRRILWLTSADSLKRWRWYIFIACFILRYEDKTDIKSANRVLYTCHTAFLLFIALEIMWLTIQKLNEFLLLPMPIHKNGLNFNLILTANLVRRFRFTCKKDMPYHTKCCLHTHRHKGSLCFEFPVVQCSICRSRARYILR